MFCSRSCQKNSSRGTRSVAESQELRRRASDHFSRARWLAHDLYALPPSERFGMMAKLIDAARTHDAQLGNILADPNLLAAGREDRGLFHRRAPGTYKTIAQAADAYCRKFWGNSVKAVICNRCPEPETGEVAKTQTPDIRLRTYKGEMFQGTACITFRLSPNTQPPERLEGWDFREWLAQLRGKGGQGLERSVIQDAA